MNSDTEIVAYSDETTLPFPTIRHNKCELLVQNGRKRCQDCSYYRHCLRSMLSQKKTANSMTSSRVDPSSHVNYRFLTDEEKDTRLHHLHQQVRATNRKLDGLTKKLEEIAKIQGSKLDKNMDEDMRNIMRENAQVISDTHPAGSFARVFWEQQLQASSQCDARQMRWLPAMIKWCLYLRHRLV
ncbi:hypothetical protein SPONN_484 [uncultured Candidatus Thioglobus sp.]|nr:hypothetical protein SPONN_484 [uncultured Candidatus Thioglobus sp.]